MPTELTKWGEIQKSKRFWSWQNADLLITFPWFLILLGEEIRLVIFINGHKLTLPKFDEWELFGSWSNDAIIPLMLYFRINTWVKHLNDQLIPEIKTDKQYYLLLATMEMVKTHRKKKTIWFMQANRWKDWKIYRLQHWSIFWIRTPTLSPTSLSENS